MREAWELIGTNVGFNTPPHRRFQTERDSNAVRADEPGACMA